MTGCLLAGGVASISWNCVYHHLEYCIPITVSATLNWARIPAAERLDDPFPIFAFSSTVTRKPRSANRIAVKALDEPPPTRTTWSADLPREKDWLLLTGSSFFFEIALKYHQSLLLWFYYGLSSISPLSHLFVSHCASSLCCLSP